ncbi:hypothetical protein CEXT_160351 [Caerostris extrusa]|uniref:Uncharacterized protein n=1 Tax=Caerostris extrusa TaxID=172846 RepID=A0AAV4WKD3_CAEEX|nr:hypothetical protein CEXT_160351 [Caerostris extrusa]
MAILFLESSSSCSTFSKALLLEKKELIYTRTPIMNFSKRKYPERQDGIYDIFSFRQQLYRIRGRIREYECYSLMIGMELRAENGMELRAEKWYGIENGEMASGIENREMIQN